MKYLDEFRDPSRAKALAEEIRRTVTRPWTLMEVCGGQTHAILRHGLDQILPDRLRLLHGPGCPVCVTPVELVDKAIAIARRPGSILCSFGDMLRVPGSAGNLLAARAAGADVRVVYNPVESLDAARQNPGREVVFFAVGFETTAPATAMTVHRAREEGLRNFSLLVSHVLVPPAIEAILSAPDRRVQAFLAAGHVCTVMGFTEYEPIAAKYHVPIIVTGFEPLDILEGVLLAVRQLERGEARVENAYARSVRREGNLPAQDLIRRVFRVIPRRWRGIGEIPQSGLGLATDYADFDAEMRFGAAGAPSAETGECRSGAVLQGLLRPGECPAFGTRCTPERPLGATMVSSEGACAAYYRYRR
ncbi:MAG: hydrogenase formation protein HypD [Planctomycetota bacterium]